MNFSGLHSRIANAAARVAALNVSAIIPFTKESTDSFDRQWEYVEDDSRAIAMVCSRRSGKSVGSAIKTCKRNTEQPGRKVLYIHHTRLLAKRQFYKKARAWLKKHRVPHECNDSELLIEWANGSILSCIGCDDIAAVGKARGDDWDEIIVEEVQEFREVVLKELLDEALLPTMFDRGGHITLQGTPPDVHAGVWWDVINNPTWSHRRWTLFENPHIKREDVIETMALRGFKIDFVDLTKNDPIVQREVFGMLAIDGSKLAYLYEPGRNDIDEEGRPEPEHEAWRYAMGIDLGFQDCDAIVVLGWRMDDPQNRLWECYSWNDNHVLFDTLAGEVKDVYRRFRPRIIVGDTGGHGAVKVIESLADRLGVGEIQRKPASLRDSVALVNDEYRAGRMKIVKGGRLATDSRKVIWNDKRDEFSTIFHSDVTEAARYAHHAALMAGFFRGKAPSPPPTMQDERAKRREDRAKRIRDPFAGTSAW